MDRESKRQIQSKQTEKDWETLRLWLEVDFLNFNNENVVLL